MARSKPPDELLGGGVMKSKQQGNAAATTAAPYFYSFELDECAGCGEQMTRAGARGTVALDVEGRPQLIYTLCYACGPRVESKNPYFMKRLGQRLIKRAGELGSVR